MQLARVLGSTVATTKHASMHGRKLMVVVPLMSDGETVDGFPQVAMDCDGVGAGRGETVIISSDGRYARDMLNVDATPVRWTIIGIKD